MNIYQVLTSMLFCYIISLKVAVSKIPFMTFSEDLLYSLNILTVPVILFMDLPISTEAIMSSCWSSNGEILQRA